MKLADIVNGAWMIKPGMLEEIQNIYAVHLRGEKIDLKSVEARLGRPLDNEQEAYQVENGTAIIPVHGVIAKKMNLFSRISGGVSSQKLVQDYQAAVDDPYVEKILLYIDSPGGAADGTFEAADYIYNNKSTKPVIAYTDGQMASAAYLIASAADKRYISSEATDVGSIGVITKHTDISKREEQYGQKTTVITAGKYKGTGHQYAPLSDQDQAIIQGQLDHIYTAFVDTVARNMALPVETVVNDMAEGREFIGSQAVKAGLVNGMATMEQLTAPINSDSYQGLMACAADPQPALNGPTTYVEAKGGSPAAKGAALMNIEALKEQHPELYQAVLAEGQTLGATAERARITAIQALPAAGHKDLIQAAIEDGSSSAGDVALAIMQKEQAVRDGRFKDMQADAPLPVGAIESVEQTAEQMEATTAVSVMVQYAKDHGRA